MGVVFVADPAHVAHRNPGGHPERPERVDAVLAGARDAGVTDALVPIEPRQATRDELLAVHSPDLLDRLVALDSAGGGVIDPDTSMSPGSLVAALHAAGSGLAAIEALDSGTTAAAFCAVRPPGHHATPTRSMGFCLFNNIAVTAAALRARGERVLILDWDVHHGNGTQAAFYDDPRVAFVSWHQAGLYPGTGSARERGEGAGTGTTVNMPLPPGATGDVYLESFDRVVEPLAEAFAPTWVLVSAGFDAHRRDPLSDMGLSAGDFGALMHRSIELAPARRRIAFLEGGYDLDALSWSAAAALSSMLDVRGARGTSGEEPTSGGPGRLVIDEVARAVT